MRTIFVAIASYRDPELPDTIVSLFRNAGDPRRIRLAIVDQCAPEEALSDLSQFGAHISYCQMHYTQSRGVGMARALAAQFYRDEDIYLQVDAHTQFEPGWDRWIEQTMRGAPSERTVFTAYPPPYLRTESGGIQLERQAPNTATVGYCAEGAAFDEEGKSWTLTIASAFRYNTRPVPSMHLAAGLVFGPAHLIVTVPHDPLIYFYGEEPTWAARLWTHGYDLYHPIDVPLYHRYNNKEQTVRPVHWRPEDEEHRARKWWQDEDLSNARQRALFTGQLQGTIYGLGTARTLEEFAEYSGIDYLNRRVLPHAYTIRGQ